MKSYKSSFLYVALFALIFMPVIIMLALTGIAMAEAPVPEQNLVIPAPVCTPTPMAEDDADIDSDSFGNHSYIFRMKAGEERTVRFNIATGNAPETYILEPNMVISEASDSGLSSTDDWVYCTNDWDELVLFANDRKEVIFDILPSEKTPEGHYEFTYRIIKDFSEILPDGIDIHHDSVRKLLEDNTRLITIVVDIIP